MLEQSCCRSHLPHPFDKFRLIFERWREQLKHSHPVSGRFLFSCREGMAARLVPGQFFFIIAFHKRTVNGRQDGVEDARAPGAQAPGGLFGARWALVTPPRNPLSVQDAIWNWPDRIMESYDSILPILTPKPRQRISSQTHTTP